MQLRDLNSELLHYIGDVRQDDRFLNIKTIAELSKKMVDTKKHLTYPLVYRLLKLVLVLPVATATVREGLFRHEDSENIFVQLYG